jgi:hypothetical protein
MATTKNQVEIDSYTPLEKLLFKPAEDFIKSLIDKAIEKDIVRKNTVLIGLSILSQLYPGKFPRTRAKLESRTKVGKKSRAKKAQH